MSIFIQQDRNIRLPAAYLALALSALLAAQEAVAARDAGQLIEQQKANDQAIERRALAASDSFCPSRVLPLDHGPRATTTPALNEQRHAQLRECDAAASKATSH